jgi:hypothetical protein
MQYKSVGTSDYSDRITGTLTRLDDNSSLLPLNYKTKRGIADWPGQWGADGSLPNTAGPRGPFQRTANTSTGAKLNLQSNPVEFHNLCKKLISGVPQPETEL